MRRITGELAGITEAAMREATVVIRNARRALRTATGHRKGRLHRAINRLETVVVTAKRVVAQTRSRLAGVMPESANRVVSLHDVDARPIRKGRLGKPVEFGYKAQIVDNADGVILDHNVEMGNPADAPQLAPAIERITTRTGRPRARSPPTAATAKLRWNSDLHELGVRNVAIPRRSKPTAARREFEHRRAFRDKVKWRTGSEGRINHVKRSYGWNRTELTGLTGARTWCGHGVFAHNLVFGRHRRRCARTASLRAYTCCDDESQPDHRAAAGRLVEQGEPDDQRDRRLEAHERPERRRRQPSQREQLERERHQRQQDREPDAGDPQLPGHLVRWCSER